MSNERIERIRADLSTRDKWTLEDYRDFYHRDVVETLLPELDRLRSIEKACDDIYASQEETIENLKRHSRNADLCQVAIVCTFLSCGIFAVLSAIFRNWQ